MAVRGSYLAEQVQEVMLTIRNNGPMTEAMRKKLLDREVTWDEIAEKDRPLFEEARQAEWDCWLKFGSEPRGQPRDSGFCAAALLAGHRLKV